CSELSFAEFAALGEVARQRVARMRTAVDDGSVRVTISSGVTRALADQKFRETFSRADKALYDAKEGGRNRIVLSYDTAPPLRQAARIEPVAKVSPI
ncbi:MAG: diguanylate cyclase, partial [Hoeflea sp.]|nr:diguanylate cyclase [Hoeflea sp.]